MNEGTIFFLGRRYTGTGGTNVDVVVKQDSGVFQVEVGPNLVWTGAVAAAVDGARRIATTAATHLVALGVQVGGSLPGKPSPELIDGLVWAVLTAARS